MSTEIIKGNQIQLFYNGRTFSWAQSHTLNLTGNTGDVSSKDHGIYTATEVMSVTWEVTGDYFYSDNSYDELFDLMMYRRPIVVEIAEVKNYSDMGLTEVGGDTPYWSPSVITRRGYAVITSLNVNANNGENATYSITLTGNGPLVVVDSTYTNYYIDVKYDPEALSDGMQLFNTRANASINSVWVYDTWNNRSRINTTDGKLHDATPEPSHTMFRYYFSSSEIPDYIFQNNTNIVTCIACQNIYRVGAYAFASSSITTFNTNYEQMRYQNCCFNDCNFLSSINESHGINYLDAKQIANNAFSTCVRLGDINTGNACEYVLAGAFTSCIQMSTIYFGDSLKRLGDGVFNVDSHKTNNTFHFYTEEAPYLGTLPLGPVGMQTIYLHNSSSVNEWLQSNNTWSQYSEADIQIAN